MSESMKMMPDKIVMLKIIYILLNHGSSQLLPPDMTGRMLSKLNCIKIHEIGTQVKRKNY